MMFDQVIRKIMLVSFEGQERRQWGRYEKRTALMKQRRDEQVRWRAVEKRWVEQTAPVFVLTYLYGHGWDSSDNHAGRGGETR